jgi:Tfp pilus assembly protein PilX
MGRDPAAERGAVLVVALLLAAAIALVLGSYLTLSSSSLRMAKRTFDGYAALNLAETGAEEGVWSFNRSVVGDTAGAWGNWTVSGTAAWRKFTGYDFGDNSSGSVKVYVPNTDTSGTGDRLLVTDATVSSPSGSFSEKMLEVTVRRRSLFANGLVAKNSVTFAGTNASVDSWNSDPDNDPSTAPVPYSAAVRDDRGGVATTSVLNSAVALNQAHVWGYVATGGGQPSVGSNGTILGANSPPGVSVDAARISTDFVATLPVVSAPVGGTYIATLGSTLGTPGLATSWRTPSISLSGSSTLTVYGNVTLVLLAGPGTTAVSLTGKAMIVIAPNSSLTLYVEGDVKVAGNGISNTNTQPATCQIYGTNTAAGGQSFDLSGNGALNCVCYAPNADLKLNGNGDIMGAFVGNSITLTGNAAFHFDESLGLLGTAQYGMIKWRELVTPDERAAYAGYFAGW